MPSTELASLGSGFRKKVVERLSQNDLQIWQNEPDTGAFVVISQIEETFDDSVWKPLHPMIA